MGRSPGLTLQASIVQDNMPIEIAPRVFVGSIHAAFNVDELKHRNITHVVNLAGNYATFPDDFTYLSISIRDKEYTNLLSCLPVLFLFLDAALADNDNDERGVLIHCAGGRSRSPAVAAAHLMVAHRLSFDEALARIRKVRPVVSLNAGFEAQLRYLDKTNGDVFTAHQLVLQEKLMTIMQQRDDGLLDMEHTVKKHPSRHRHHHMPRTPKAEGASDHGRDLLTACDDRGMIHGTVPCGFSLSLPENASKGQHFIPTLRSMGALFGCRTCGENLFSASALVDQCQSKNRHVPEVDREIERCQTTPCTNEAKIKRPLLAKLRLRPQSPGGNGADFAIGGVGTSKSNPTTPRFSVLKHARRAHENGSRPTSPKLHTQQQHCDLTKSGSTSDLSGGSHTQELSRTNSASFWKSLTSFKSSTKRSAKELEDERKKKAVLSPKAVAIDLSCGDRVEDRSVDISNLVEENEHQWQRKLAQLALSWARSQHASTKCTATTKALSTQLQSLLARDARTLALLEKTEKWCISPPAWLSRADLQDTTGTIICPNEQCGAILGQWQWEGTTCSCGCGQVVLPTFAVNKTALRKLGHVVTPPVLPGDSHISNSAESTVGHSHEPCSLHRFGRN